MQIFLVQDGRVEGRVLISSCEGTTSCWVTTNRTLEPTKKDIPHSKTRSHKEMVGGAQSWWNQIWYPLGGWLTKWRTITPKKFSHCCEPHVRLPSLGIQQRDCRFPDSPGNLTLKASRTGLQGFHKTGGNKRLQPWRAQTKFSSYYFPQRKGASVGGSRVEEVWVRRGSPQGMGATSLGRSSLGYALLEVASTQPQT